MYKYELREMRRGWVKMYKQHPTFQNEFDVRRTGRTTGLALEAIGYAMSNPGRKVTVRNHHVGGEPATNKMHEMALMRTKELVTELRLEFFKFDRFECTIQYSPPKWSDDVKV